MKVAMLFLLKSVFYDCESLGNGCQFVLSIE